MPTEKVKKNSNGCLPTRKAELNGKLPTQRDIAASFDETKLTKAEREAIEASERVIKMMDEAEKNGFVW